VEPLGKIERGRWKRKEAKEKVYWKEKEEKRKSIIVLTNGSDD